MMYLDGNILGSFPRIPGFPLIITCCMWDGEEHVVCGTGRIMYARGIVRDL